MELLVLCLDGESNGEFGVGDGEEIGCKISYILLLIDIYAQHIYLCFK